MKCFINIPVLGRTTEAIETSVNQMLAIARAKWGDDVEVAIPGIKSDKNMFFNESEPDFNYLKECISALDGCDCAIVVLDTHFCKDNEIIGILNSAIQMKGLTVVALHCMDWFPDAIQSMDNVPIC